jgi:hypothetical protein
VEFVVGKAALDRFFFQYFVFPPFIITPPMLHIHLHLHAAVTTGRKMDEAWEPSKNQRPFRNLGALDM